jgi:hypothetical protein
MPSLIKQSHNVYMSVDDLDGLLTRFKHEVAERGEDGEWVTPYYVGASIAVHIFRYHEFVNTQDDFMQLFAAQLRLLNGDEEGVEDGS